MKYLIASFIFTFSLQTFACNQSVDSSRVVLFVDANDSPREITSARQAACTRGETLVVVEPSDFNSRVNQLATSGTSITSLIASGHDGGGSFGGKTGDISKREMLSSLNEAYESAGNSELLENLHGLYLWGCYTTVPGEIDYWNSQLPNVKFIVGFQGSGPSNTNATGIAMLRSALESQERVEQASTTKDLRAVLNSIQGINTTYSATFVNSCENMEDQFYYTNTSNGNGGLNRTFASYAETKVCIDKVRSFEEGDPSMHSIVSSYFHGDKPIPTSTSGTDLRSIYSFFRQNDHCFTEVYGDSAEYNANNVGLLLFYHGAKQNFPLAFGSVISAASRELQSLKTTASDETREVLKELWMPDQETISTKSRSEILRNMEGLSSLSWNDNIDSSQVQKIQRLGRYMEVYLNYMPEACMGFMDWHEYKPPRVPSTRCPARYQEYLDNEFDDAD